MRLFTPRVCAFVHESVANSKLSYEFKYEIIIKIGAFVAEIFAKQY